MSDYDVIIIGSGAGGGTLARHLAPSGKRILLLERGDWLPREPQNWTRAGRLRRQPLRLAGHLVRRATASRSSRRSTTSSAARPSSTARRSTGCARRTSASCATTTASRRRGRSATTRWSRTTRRPSSSTRCTARAARTRPSRRRARPTRSRPSRTSRASSSSPTTSRPPGYHPFHAPCGVMLDEANMPYSACVRCATCDGFPCLVHAKSDAEVLGVRPGARARQRHAADQRRGGAAGDQRRRHGGHRRGGRARRRARDVHAADIVVVSLRRGQLAPAAARSANDAHPNGLANGSDQVGRNYMFHNSQAVLALSKEENPTVFQKTLGLNDFYFGERRLRVPAGQHPDGRQVRGADVPRREAGRDEARARSGRWRRSPATRSTSGSRPRTCRGRRTA